MLAQVVSWKDGFGANTFIIIIYLFCNTLKLHSMQYGHYLQATAKDHTIYVVPITLQLLTLLAKQLQFLQLHCTDM